MNASSVLIVEDEAIVAMDLQAILQEQGYDAFAVASSADEALAAASSRLPDVVLMDIRIKGTVDGVETAALLQAQFDLPIVYLTSHADRGTLERAKQTEPYGYLQKPVRTDELRSALEVALYKHGADRQARRRQRWFETTLKSIADAVVAVDVDGHVAFMNEAAAALTGVAPDDALGADVRSVLHLRDQVDLPVLQALSRREPVELLRGELQNRSGGSAVIADSAAPVVDSGDLLGAVMVFRDVTEADRLQRRLELTDRLASLGTLAAGVAHEVNNPLGAVLANAQFVAQQLAEHRVGDAVAPDDLSGWRDAMADVVSASQRIARIVADLRAFSRPTPRPEAAVDVDVARCIDWAVRLTRPEVAPRARLVLDPVAVSPVRGDETRIGQVLTNLMVNAAQAIPPGRADHHTVRVATWERDDVVVIAVSDTGSGMSDDVRRRVFDPFFTTKAVGGGTGLGLSICHGIVTALGGSIEIDSVVGQGTTVRVNLPKLHPSLPLVVAPPTRAPLSRLRILAIDDERVVLRMLERVLRQHDVTTCDSAADALDLLARDAAYDVILCDVTMPALTGVDFYRLASERFPGLARRVLFMSGGAITPELGAFLDENAARSLPKPFDVDALLAAIAAVARA